MRAADCLNEVVTHIDGIYVVCDFEITVLHKTDAQAQNSCCHACRAVSALRPYKRFRKGTVCLYGARGEHQQRQIYHNDTDNCRQQVVEQLGCLARIGGHEIEEHIDRDDRTPEQIEQYHLERCEEDKREEYPYHLAGLAAERHEKPICRYRQHHVGDACHDRHALGEGKHHIGQCQGYYREYEKHVWRRAEIVCFPKMLH